MWIVKTTKPPDYLKARVAYLRVPGPRTQLWVIDPDQATHWGDKEDAKKAAAITQQAECVMVEHEEKRSVSRPTDTGSDPPARKIKKRSGGSIFD